MSEPEKFSYNVREASLALGISQRTVWKQIAAGELAAFKMFGRTLLTRETLRNAVNSRSREAA